MPIRHAIWKIGPRPERLLEASLGKEALLEEMISADPSILSDRWLLVGRQVPTTHGGFVDLLALNGDAQLVVIELKRDQTPREVVAQALDYASWAKGLRADELATIYDRYTQGGSLGDAFRQRFGLDLDEEALNGSHQVVIVASVLDASTERIVTYLNEMDVPINVIFFQVFADGATQYLSRAWLIDPVETDSKASSASQGSRVDWNGEYYVSFGHGPDRDWNEAIRYGFVSAGGGEWYTRTLRLLSEGDRVWVNVPTVGYVGVGKVTGPVVPAKGFLVEIDGVKRPFLEIARATYHRAAVDDEKVEYLVPVEWIETRPITAAVSEVGLFGNQNTVCRPRTSKWDHTVERLKRQFTTAA